MDACRNKEQLSLYISIKDILLKFGLIPLTEKDYEAVIHDLINLFIESKKQF